MEERSPLDGCSDGYCKIAGPAKGMHTNAGCRCLRYPEDQERFRVALNALRADRDEKARLLERANAKIAQLKRFNECFVFHPYEGTLECDVAEPCPFCRYIHMEAKLESANLQVRAYGNYLTDILTEMKERQLVDADGGSCGEWIREIEGLLERYAEKRKCVECEHDDVNLGWCGARPAPLHKLHCKACCTIPACWTQA